MTIRKISSLATLALAPIWLPFQLARYRGHFSDSATRATELLLREAPLRSFAEGAGISVVNPFDRFPGLDQETVQLVPGHWSSSHEQIEYPLLSAICSLLVPRRIFEFGTYLGEATLMFAKASPAAEIVTLNIPENEFPVLGISEIQKTELLANSQIGKLFRGTFENHRIEQIFCDSANFDVSPHCDKYDFIWVDAGHSYENVRMDSLNALKMIREGGSVFWHDFDASQAGVTRALLEIAKDHNLFWIEKTSIVGFEKH